MTVEPTDTIEQVKEYLEEKEGIPPAQQNLIFNTKLLGINLTVEECGITEGSVVSLVLTLRGGA